MKKRYEVLLKYLNTLKKLMILPYQTYTIEEAYATVENLKITYLNRDELY